MGITHNYLNTTAKKPTAAEIAKAELAINLIDKTIWTKNDSGVVVELGKAYDDSDVLKDADALSAVNAGNKLITETDIAGLGGGDMLVSQYDTGGAYTNSVDSADTVLGFTVLTNVPAGAVFTDHQYTGGTGISLNGNALDHDSHTGDVTGSTALTIVDGKVTLAKMANMATNSFIGRDTASAGVPEILSATTARAILNVEDNSQENNMSDANVADLIAGNDSTLHYHDSDRNRANHTGTQLLSTISDAGTAAAVDTGTATGEVPILDGSGWLNTSVLPPLAITTTHVAADETAQLALTVQEGDVAVRTDENKTYIALNDTNGAMSDWQVLSSPTDRDTDLAIGAQSPTIMQITSTTGDNVDLIEADTTNAGLLGADKWDEIVANTAAKHTHSNATILDNTTASFITADETKLDYITVTGAVDLDTLSTNSHTHSNKTILDNTTASFITADETKLDFISVTQAVDLDTMESNQTGSLLTGEAV